MSKTLQERYSEALINKFNEKIVEKRRKYWIVSRPHDTYYFLGNSGSIRIGRVYSESVPVSDKFKKELLEPETETDGDDYADRAQRG